MITSSSEFIRLRQSECSDEYNRAAHEEITDDAIRDIINIHKEFIQWVIHNKKVPEWVLRDQMNSPDSQIRYAVASKRKCPEDVMMVLATDSNESVRMAIACNAKVTRPVLNIMIDDSWVNIREKVQQRLTIEQGASWEPLTRPPGL